MARLAYNTFEGGTDGTGITSGNSGGASGDAFNTVSGTADYDNDTPAPLVGAMSAYINAASGSTSSVRLDYTSSTTVYFRFYFYKTGNPAAVTTLARLFDSGTGGVDLRVNTSGALVFRNAGGTTINTSAALASNTLHRIEGRVVHSDTVGRMMLRIFSGTNAHGLAPDLEYGDTVSDRDTNAQSDNFRFGVLSNPSTGGWTAYIDDVELDDADWVGPSDRPTAIADLAGTAGDTEVDLTHSASTSESAAITDYVYQYASAFTASAFGTSTNEGGTSLGASNAQPLPSSAASGDLIVAIIGHDTATTALSVSTGWTALAPVAQGNNVIKGLIAARVLDGTTGDNILSVSGTTQDYAVALLRFPSGSHGCTNDNLANDLVYGSAQGSSGNADPPNVSAGYSADRVWIAACVVDSSSSSVSAVPTNYTSRENVTSATSSSSVIVCAATRDVTASSSEDPGAFTNTSRNWIAYTIGVPPTGWSTFADGTSSSTGTTVTSLSNGTAYTFRAAAVSALGQGPWSNVAGPYTPTGGGTDANISASTVTATATVLAPTASAGASVAAAAVTSTVAVLPPTVTTGATATPATVTATVAVIGPTVTAGSSAIAGVVTATAAAIPPSSVSASASATVSATVVTATATAIAPTVTAGGGANITAAAVTATAAAIAPTVTAGATATAATVTRPAAVLAPTVTAGTNANITAPVTTATATAQAPALTTGTTITPSTVTALAAVLAAFVTSGLVPLVTGRPSNSRPRRPARSLAARASASRPPRPPRSSTS